MLRYNFLFTKIASGTMTIQQRQYAINPVTCIIIDFDEVWFDTNKTIVMVNEKFEDRFTNVEISFG